MTTREKYVGYIQRAYEDLTQETVNGGWPVMFGDDFVGASHAGTFPTWGAPTQGYPWAAKIVKTAGSPVVAPVANASNGILQVSLASTSEAEEATLGWSDVLNIDPTKNSYVEFRASLAVAPSATSSAFLGFGSAWVTGGITAFSRYAGFYWSNSGALLLRGNDGNSSTISVAAAQIGGSAISSDTASHIFAIDLSNSADIAFYYDGNRVNALNSFAWTNTSGNNAQPIAQVYKSAGTNVTQLNVDKFDWGSAR